MNEHLKKEGLLQAWYAFGESDQILTAESAARQSRNQTLTAKNAKNAEKLPPNTRKQSIFVGGSVPQCYSKHQTSLLYERAIRRFDDDFSYPSRIHGGRCSDVVGRRQH